jgi:hypothetical protein
MTDDPLDDLLRDAARSYHQPPEPPRDLMWSRIERARAARATPVAIHWGRNRWLRTASGLAAVLLAGIVIGRATSAPRAGNTGGSASATRVAVPGPGLATSKTRDSMATPIQLSRVDTEPGDERLGTAAASSGDSRIGTERSTRVASGTDMPRRSRGGDARSSYNVPRQGRGAVGDGTEMNAYRLAVVEHLARTEVLLTGFRAQSRQGTADARTAGQQFAVLSRELLQNTRLLLATHATDDPTLTRLLEDLELVLMQISQYAEEGRHGDLDAINQSLDRRNVLPKLRSTIPAGAPVPAGT